MKAGAFLCRYCFSAINAFNIPNSLRAFGLMKFNRNIHEDFDSKIEEKLGWYVYGLFDPKDRLPFYIGKAGGKYGQGNERVLSHFKEARNKLNQQNISRKVQRIHKIWKTSDVSWKILRRNLRLETEALEIEAAIIDALKASGVELTNRQLGHGAAERGSLTNSEVYALKAELIEVGDVSTEYRNRPIFVFNIHNAVEKMIQNSKPIDYVRATSCCWIVGEKYRNMTDAVAIGLIRGVSHCVVGIDGWKKANLETKIQKWEIIFKNDNELEKIFLHKNYSKLLEPVAGYLKYGGFPVFQVNPDGDDFEFLRGKPIQLKN